MPGSPRSRLLLEVAAVAVLMTAATALRWWVFETGRSDFDSDEAITSLMAKDIWLGRDFPVFFSGQTYGGSLESYFTALFFAARGRSDVAGVRLAGVALMVAGFSLYYAFIRWAAGRGAALMALALLVCAPGYFTVWSVKQRGGYLLLPILSIAIWWSALALDEAMERATSVGLPLRKWIVALGAILGLAVGLGWWTHRSVISALGALALMGAWRSALRWRRGQRIQTLSVWAIPSCAAGFLIGYAPVLWFIARGGRPRIPFQLADAGQVRQNARVLLEDLMPALLGAPVADGGLPKSLVLLTALAATVAVAGCSLAVRRARTTAIPRQRNAACVLLFSAAIACVAMVFNEFTRFVGGDPRHLIVVVYVLAAAIALGWAGSGDGYGRLGRKRRWPAFGATGLLAVYGLSTTIALSPDPLNDRYIPKRYEPLIDFLTSRQARACYWMDGNLGRGYWDAEILTFYRDERIVFAAPQPVTRLPRHAEFARLHQRPAVWVSRFPADLVAQYSAAFFRHPLEIHDLGEFRVTFSDETERMYEVVYRLVQEPWYHPRQ